YGSPTVLMAQSVPGASMIPCVKALPLGWHFRSFDSEAGLSSFSLDSEIGGDRALQVTLQPRCSVARWPRWQSDESEVTLYRRVSQNAPIHEEEWAYTFSGGCAVYRFTIRKGDTAALTGQIARGVSFMTRGAV